jgi:hypothetical protein
MPVVLTTAVLTEKVRVRLLDAKGKEVANVVTEPGTTVTLAKPLQVKKFVVEKVV